MTPQSQAPAQPTQATTLQPDASNGNAGSPFRSVSSGRKRAKSKSKAWLVVGLMGLLATAAGATWMLMPKDKGNANVVWRPVVRQTIELKIMERGELQSADNVDIICKVKVGRGERGPTIKWLIDPGTQVQKGDEILKLEDSAFWKEYLDQEIVLQKAKNDYEQAKAAYDIVQAKYEAELKVAQLDIETAQKTLEKYRNGDAKQLKKQVDSDMLLAKAEVERWEQRVAFVRQMVRKKSYSQAQLNETLDSLQSSREKLATVQEQYRVLNNYEIDLQLKTLSSLVAQAESMLKQKEATALAEISAAKNLRDTTLLIMKQEQAKYDEIAEEIEKCTIRAPQSGLLVYYESERSRRSSDSEKIEVGASVSEGQKLMQIPDLNHMLVITRVHEALVSNVKGRAYERTGIGEGLQIASMAPFSPYARLTSAIGYPEMRKSRAGKKLKALEQRKIYDGHRAEVIVDSQSAVKLRGRVTDVATVATKQWFSDVRTYETTVEILDPVTDLKPGMSARVTIFTDRRAENVLAIPVQAVYRKISKDGVQHFVYVKTPEGPKERQITVGINNAKMVEVKSGLEEGEEVAENPMALHRGENGEISMPVNKDDKNKKGGRGSPGGGGGQRGARPQ